MLELPGEIRSAPRSRFQWSMGERSEWHTSSSRKRTAAFHTKGDQRRRPATGERNDFCGAFLTVVVAYGERLLRVDVTHWPTSRRTTEIGRRGVIRPRRGGSHPIRPVSSVRRIFGFGVRSGKEMTNSRRRAPLNTPPPTLRIEPPRTSGFNQLVWANERRGRS
jgi:hypothetical protein